MANDHIYSPFAQVPAEEETKHVQERVTVFINNM